MKIKDYRLKDILFLDIETVPQKENYNDLDASCQKLWDLKSSFIDADATPETTYRRAGIYAEFGRVICITAGFIVKKGRKNSIRLKSFFGHDEHRLLEDFASLLHANYSKSTKYLCAHNGKEFDFPYLCRRMLVNGIGLPDILDMHGKKPWEVRHLDTMELWKFGDYKHYTSLNLMACLFNIPTPKDDIDGSQVYDVYYKEKDLERIERYCRKDVVTVARIFLSLRGQETIDQDQIFIGG